MKPVVISYLIIILATISFGFTQGDWLTTTSKDGGFAISMPGKPLELDAPIVLGDFHAVSHVFHVRRGGNAYSVTYTDLAIDPSDETIVAKVFDGAKEDLLKKATARLTSETNIKLKENAGREIKAVAVSGYVICRTYLVKNRMYQVVVVSGSEEPSAEVKRFLDSFSLVDSEGER